MTLVRHTNKSTLAIMGMAVLLAGCAPSMDEQPATEATTPPVTDAPTPLPTQESSGATHSPSFSKVVETVQGLADQVGGKVTETFDAGGNITGHVVTVSENDLRIAYSTAGGSRILLGTLMDPDGNNLTDGHIEQRLPKVDLEGTFAELEKLNIATLTTGKVPSTMRVIYDPLCGFCKELYRIMSEKDLQVHWHPVAIMGPEAVSISAGMIAERDNSEEVMARAQTQEGRSELSSVGLGNDSARTAADLNWAVASKSRVNGTPAVYWKLADGTVKVVRGRPSPEELAGILEQAKIN